ncbi:MAG: hypothetical protein DRJ01_01795 [Bacteroidetes bacterium]|nr:MAG: hypothetical protein DRJ01_01795 [Bacteroidota bacterium]
MDSTENLTTGRETAPNDGEKLSKENLFAQKLPVYDWLEKIPSCIKPVDLVEIKFKNTRKGFYINSNHLLIKKGDVVAVEASPGHDIGVVSLTGELVLEQIKKYNVPPKTEFKKIYRKAKTVDFEKWKEAISLEHSTMIESRKIATNLNLKMKIGDVEYQGDKTKAIFYYIAEERVDFRELIIILAEKFHIRIEMRQIGARQEAGRIGGIGPCGRELCCSTWLSNFISVTTNSARIQELSLNPQKLAGQCGKLKCCLNYELETYNSIINSFPDKQIVLETKQGSARCQKIDIFKKLMWYNFDNKESNAIIPISVNRVKKIIELNKKGVIVDNLVDKTKTEKNIKLDYENVVGQESLTRFDKKKRKKRNKKK